MRFRNPMAVLAAMSALCGSYSHLAQPVLADEPLPDRAVARVGGAAIRHQNAHGGVALIDDGKTVVTFPNRVGKHYEVRFWDAETGQKLQREIKGLQTLRKVTLACDGRTLLGYKAINHLLRIDLAEGKVTLELKLDKIGRGHGLTVSDDGELIVCSGNADTAVIDGASGKIVKHLGIPGSSVGLAPGGKRLAISPGHWGRAKYGGRVLLVDLTTGEITARTSDKFGKHFNEVCFSRDGEYFVGLAYGRDPSLNVFNGTTAEHVRRLEAGDRLAGMTLQGRTLAVAARKRVGIWDIETGRRRHWIPSSYVRSNGLAFSADGKRLAIKGHNGIVDVRDVATGESVLPRGSATSPMYRAVVEPGPGGAVWTSDLAGRIQRWIPHASGYRLDRTAHLADTVARMELVRDGRALLVIEADQAGWIDTANPGQIKTIDLSPLRPAGFKAVWPVDDGRQLMAIDETGTIRRMALPAGKVEVVLASAVNAAALSDESPESIISATFSDPGQWALIHQLRGPVLVNLHAGGKTFVKSNRRADCTGFAPRGDTFATVSSRRLAVWEVDSAREIMQLENSNSLLDAAAYLADGRLLAVGNIVGGIHIFDVVTGREVSYLQGHSDSAKAEPALARQRSGGPSCRIMSLRYVPRQQWLISAADDGSAMIWDVGDIQPAKLDSAQRSMDELWKQLAQDDPKAAWPALLELARRDGAEAFLSDKLASETAIDFDEVDTLVAQLDSKRFQERRGAYEALAAMGPRAAGALRKSLAARSISAESRRRVEALLDSWSQAAGGPGLVHRRAVRVLERIATAQARQTLKRLAKGDEQGMLTIAATQALRRLEADTSRDKPGQ